MAYSQNLSMKLWTLVALCCLALQGADARAVATIEQVFDAASNITKTDAKYILATAPPKPAPAPGSGSIEDASPGQAGLGGGATCTCDALAPLLDAGDALAPLDGSQPTCQPAGPSGTPPAFGQDPSMVFYNGLYVYADVDFYQSVYVRVSTDMNNIMNTGWQAVYTEPGPGPEPQPFLTESPDISVFHDTTCDCNKFIIYYASITRNTISMLMSADDNPLGTYTFMGELGLQGYDPNLMYHPRGLFLLYSNFNQLNIVQLSGIQPWVVIRGPTTIAVPDQPWELIDGQLVEAPASIVIGGVANVVYSTNAYWLASYTCGILRSPATADPLDATAWVKSPVPVFSSNVANSAYGPGSGTFFTDGNNQLWWGYGAFNNPGGVPSNAAGRTIRMQVSGITADGSVCLGTPGSYPST